MRGIVAVVLTVGIGGGVFRHAAAQESPFELTAAERTCRTTVARQEVGFVGGLLDCLADCRQSPSRSCGPFGFDAQTASCIDRARSGGRSRILRRCGGFSCPDCYGTSCDLFSAGAFDSAVFAGSQLTGALFCDDTFSPDGLNRAEAGCQASATRTGAQLDRALARCVESCERDARRGGTPNAACAPSRLGGPLADAKLQACADRVRGQFQSRCESKCTDRPECMVFFGCSALGAFVQDEFLGFTGQAFCPDEPPPVCGDGIVSLGEACDSSAPVIGCAAGDTCVDCTSCQSPCGNGVIDGGESCDPAATPNGCGTETLCTAGCTACGPCHDPCQLGDALQRSCGACVTQVCDLDPFCCRQAWDGICRDEANSFCSLGCGSPSAAFVDAADG